MTENHSMCNGRMEKAFESLAVGSEYIPAEEANPINVPIYSSSTFKISTVDHAEDLATGKTGWIYSRWENPTTQAASNTLNNLEGGHGTLLFSSGMAAISNALMAMLKSGDHVVLPKMVYCGTLSLVRNTFSRFGVEYTCVDGSDPEKYRQAIKPNTKVLFCETPCNPTMTLMDLEEFGKLGKSKGIITMADSTFASPFNQSPIKFGIDIVIHSCTKYIGGHSDITAGSLTLSSQELFYQCYELRKFLGGCLSPFDASLLHRGLKSIHVRMERHNSNAMELAKFLDTHPKVEKVHYPGLPSHPHHEVAKKQMKGFGGMVSFENVKIIELAVSLGGVQSLIEVAGAMTHPENVGLENVEDLKKDLEQAFEKV
ncbi:L-methionine gamma-lyase [Acropora cervicornis]|uniref:L-methionine gamma-lyase n=1 Tax=Acropora cervicornis TaxID=6130 RepID=A0AAD9V3F7_ACRCE|nr:L-methionine gamma-lyase [Acropora cervicornis]